MGFPFIFWGGGDGSSDVNTGRGTGAPPAEVPGGAAGAAGAVGAGAGALGGASEDEQIYGQQSAPQQPGSAYPEIPDERYGEQSGSGMEGYPEDPGWTEDGEEVMQDPWGQEGGDDSGWYGGGGGGGDGGSWGDWS